MVSAMMSANPATFHHLCYTANNCADLWLWYQFKNVIKPSSKFFFAQHIYYPPPRLHDNQRQRRDETDHDQHKLGPRIAADYTAYVSGMPGERFESALVEARKKRQLASHARHLKELIVFEAQLPEQQHLTSKNNFTRLRDEVAGLTALAKKSLVPLTHPRPVQYDQNDYSLIERLNFSKSIKDRIDLQMRQPFVVQVPHSIQKRQLIMRDQL